jgi:DNA-binding MarR family transcriptional regulator
MCFEQEIKTQRFDSEQSKAALNLLFTAGWFHGRINQFLRGYDLSHEQYNVLRILRGQHPKPVAQKDILERMVNRCSNLTPIIAKLKEKQWITVTRAEDDRREYRIALQEAALTTMAQIDLDFKSDKVEAINLTLEEAETLNRLLDKMRQQP